MGLGQTLATSVLGNVQKAILVIHQQDASQIDSAQVASATANALGAAAMAATGGAAPSVPGFTQKAMRVQYNPSSLSIQANAEAIPFTVLQQNIDNGIPSQITRPPMVVLSVELVFDAMNPKDAFMAEKFSLSTGGIVSSAAGAAQAQKGGYTVQPQTDGLVAALMRPSTRVVSFLWGNLSFTGQIIEVQARYTMFSVSGKPVRSTVSLNIAQQVESDADIQYWNSILDSAFNQSGEMGGKGVDQTLGNLLNLGIL